jgi:hypothetical protein
VARDVDVDVLQVVYAGAAHSNPIVGHTTRFGARDQGLGLAIR